MKYIIIVIENGEYSHYVTVEDDETVADAKRGIRCNKEYDALFHMIERVICEEGQLYHPGTMKHIGHITDYTYKASV
jgi:hypothetical protein